MPIYVQVWPPQVEVAFLKVFLFRDSPVHYFFCDLVNQRVFTSACVNYYFLLVDNWRRLIQRPVVHLLLLLLLLFFLFLLCSSSLHALFHCVFLYFLHIRSSQLLVLWRLQCDLCILLLVTYSFQRFTYTQDNWFWLQVLISGKLTF